jgi:hypothetical protein
METKKLGWKEYEFKIYETIKAAFPDSEIVYDDAIFGFYSKVERQIDFAIRATVAGKRILGIVDCKLYEKNIDLKMVESFIGMIQDVNGHFGILITNKGYSKAAKNRVKYSNLKLDVLEINELNEIQISADYFINQNIKGLQLSKYEFLRRGKQNNTCFDEEKSDYNKRRIVFKEGFANTEYYAFKKIFSEIARVFRDFEHLDVIEIYIPANKNDQSTDFLNVKFLYSSRLTKQKFMEISNLNFDHLRDDINNWRNDFINSSFSKNDLLEFAKIHINQKAYLSYDQIVFI